jgi:hypothetical protein
MREWGASLNAVPTRDLSVFAEVVIAESENTGFHPGAQFAFLPKQRYSIGATYFSDRRWSLSAKAIHRAERFQDEANTLRLEAEWSGGIQAYWETADKRWSIEAIVSNIGAKVAEESVGLTVTFRF